MVHVGFLNYFFPRKRIYQDLPTVDEFSKPHPSIYPPAPLDDVVKAAFPNRYQAYSHTRYSPTVWPYRFWNSFLIFLVIFGAAFPLIVFYRDPVSPRWFDIGLFVVSAGPILLALPMMSLFYLYKPPAPIVPAPPITSETAVAVDVLVTTYKEDLDEIAGTLAAIQNLKWHGIVNVYVLDDGKREDIADLCNGMRDFKYSVTRVVREGNAGKKAGNVNNFLKKMPKTADFFVILDCDMRPFPNMLNLLFGVYFDPKFSEEDRDRIGFVTTPQFFRNYNPDCDPFDILCSMWVNLVMPCLGNINAVPYVGTNALWKREAIERAGLFLTPYATEDVATGCAVHLTFNPNGHKYISKYLPLPVAAGLNPRTLPELMDQHNRWNIGMAQMTRHYNFFFFCKGLDPMQKFTYFCTMAGFLRHIPTFFIVWFGTIFFNVANAYIFSPSEGEKVIQFDWISTIASVCAFTLPSLGWLLLPGTSIGCKVRGIQMSFVYLPTEIAGLMSIIGFKVPIRFASDVFASTWHPLFLFHIIVYLSVLSSTLFTFIQCLSIGILTYAPYVQAIVMLSFWTFILSPVAYGIFGYEDREDKKWISLESGRTNLYQKPVWSTMENISFEQLKATVERLYQRVEQQETELKVLRGTSLN